MAWAGSYSRFRNVVIPLAILCGTIQLCYGDIIMVALLLLCGIAVLLIYAGWWIPAITVMAILLIIKIYQLSHMNEYKENLAIKKAVEQKLKERDLNSELVQTGLFSYESKLHKKS